MRFVRIGVICVLTRMNSLATKQTEIRAAAVRVSNDALIVVLAPGETDRFIVEGEKRYWLHIALARDLNTDRTVDVLGSQLEEVSE